MEYPKNDKRTDLPLVPFWDIWHILDLWPQFWHLLLLPLFSVTLLHVHCSAAYKEDNTLMVRYADQKHGEISINNICNLRVKHNTSSSRLFWFTLHSMRDFQDVWIHKTQLFHYSLPQVRLPTFSHNFKLLHSMWGKKSAFNSPVKFVVFNE